MADLKLGTTIGGAGIWNASNLALAPSGNTLTYRGYKIYSENDKPTRLDLGFGTAVNYDVGTASGNVMQVGAYGVGAGGTVFTETTPVSLITTLKATGGRFMRSSAVTSLYNGASIYSKAGDAHAVLSVDPTTARVSVISTNDTNLAAGTVAVNTLYGTANKPTPADVNAVARTGDDMTGQLRMLNGSGGIYLIGGPTVSTTDQGAYLGWNKAVGSGKIDLVCHAGGGLGGVDIWNLSNTDTTHRRLFRFEASNRSLGIGENVQSVIPGNHSIAFGDNSTGFGWIRAGTLGYYANGALAAHMNSATLYSDKQLIAMYTTGTSEAPILPPAQTAMIRVMSSVDGNGAAGPGDTHIGYSDGTLIHHYFRGNGRMNIDTKQGTTIRNGGLTLENVPIAQTGTTSNYFGGQIKLSNTDALRIWNAEYGVIFRRSETNFYIIPTAQNQGEFGAIGSLRPFSIACPSGRVTLGNGVTIGSAIQDGIAPLYVNGSSSGAGDVVINSGASANGGILINSTYAHSYADVSSLNGGGVVIDHGDSGTGGGYYPAIKSMRKATGYRMTFEFGQVAGGNNAWGQGVIRIRGDNPEGQQSRWNFTMDGALNCPGVITTPGVVTVGAGYGLKVDAIAKRDGTAFIAADGNINLPTASNGFTAGWLFQQINSRLTTAQNTANGKWTYNQATIDARVNALAVTAVQRGAAVTPGKANEYGPNEAPVGCFLTRAWHDSTTSYGVFNTYRPLQIRINGTWRTITG